MSLDLTHSSVLGDRGDHVAALQTELARLGYSIGRVDGIHGIRTEFAACRHAVAGVLGLWVWGQSDRYNRAGIADIVAQCQRWRVTDYVIGLNAQEDKAFRLDRAPGDYVTLATALHAIGVRVHLMTWARNTKAFIEGAVQSLCRLAEQTGAASVQLDAEEAWRSSSRTRPAQTGADEWLDGFDELPPGCKIGVTSYAFIPPSVEPLARIADYVIPQAYSQYSTAKAGRDSATYLPPRTQQIAQERWAPHLRPDGHRLVMGLAAYNQKRPNRSVTEEMQRAFCGAVRAGALDVAYWSRIHLAKSAEADAFLQTLWGPP